MQYTKTKVLNTYIFPSQKESLERIQSEIEEEFKTKIPISEIVRRALEYGIPELDKNRSFVLDLIGR